MDAFGGWLAGEAFALLDGGHAEGEFPANDRLIEVEALAVATPVVEAEGGAGGYAFGVGLGGHDVHCAGGSAQTE